FSSWARAQFRANERPNFTAFSSSLCVFTSCSSTSAFRAAPTSPEPSAFFERCGAELPEKSTPPCFLGSRVFSGIEPCPLLFDVRFERVTRCPKDRKRPIHKLVYAFT